MRHLFRLLLAAAVSALLLGLLLHLVRGQGEQPGLREIVIRAAGWFSLLYLVCTLAQTFVRACRYRVLIMAAGEAETPGLLHIFLVTLARNMFVDLLPARLGELSYIALLNRGYRVSAASCLSSLSISFVFDLAALLAILAALAALAFAGWMPGVLVVMVLAIGAGLLVLFPGMRYVASRAAQGTLVRKVAEAFERTAQARVLRTIFLLSLGVRLWKYAGFYCMFLAVATPSFPGMAATSPWQVLVSLISAEAASSLPVPTFMSFGAYEAGGTAAWAALGASAADAALCMLAVHIGSQFIDYTLGGLGLLGITLFSGSSAAVRKRKGLVLAALLVVLAAAAGFAVVEQRALRQKGALEAPPAGEAVTPDTGHQSPGALPSGILVWSSNRSGNHDIWSMSLPDMRVSQVTDHPNTETYPRISPDGRSIVFARAHRTWVSQRNERDWDVYWRDLASGEERLVATNATAPTWADADTVVFEEEVSRVMAHRLSTGERRVLCEGGRGNVPAGVAMQTPEYNPKDRLVAVTFRGAARMTALVDERNHFRKVGGGCQLFWSPDHVFLYYADHGGRMKNAFYQVDPATMRRDLWFDAEGEWSHEYFPKLSSDGRWLAYGASAKGHEHDTADYEIFLWKAGEPFGSSVRLTWHTGNDCWPDIFVNTVQ